MWVSKALLIMNGVPLIWIQGESKLTNSWSNKNIAPLDEQSGEMCLSAPSLISDILWPMYAFPLHIIAHNLDLV